MPGKSPGVWSRPLALGFLLVALVAAAQAGTASGAGGGALGQVLLKAAEVGPGYQLKTRSDSHCVQACVTLDLCGFTFKSEAQRTGRIQVNYVKDTKAFVVSNEVVSYQAGGASQAVGELDRAVASCPKDPVASNVRGVGPVTYRIKRLRDARLLPGAVALRLHISGVANGHHFAGTMTAVYQRRGNVLSGVYVSLSGDATAAAQWELAKHAAEASAKKLKKAVNA
jgi:hypothetical protein